MANFDMQKDRTPIGYLGGVAVDATTIIVAVLAVSMVVCALAMAVNAAPVVLMFDRDAVLRGQVWRLVSYALVNPPSFFVAVDIFLLFWFGREVEYFLGRRVFLKLYALLILAPLPLLLAIPHSYLAGARSANFAVFIAFAVIYPRAQIFFGIEARWLALGYLAVNVLQALAYHEWSWIIPLLLCSGAAFVFVRYAQGQWSFNLPVRQPKLRVIEGGKPQEPQAANVDAILEKISKSGMQSLTKQERDQLDKAREGLLRK
jgi:membrane associated rhomboid family serine protease